MALITNVWTKRSGYSFGTFQENISVNQQLPVINDAGVSFDVISGKLPNGLRINGSRIIGSPYEVAALTTFTFCIRASKGLDFADRTFSMTIDGADAPEFATAAGDLPLGDNDQLFVLDSTYIDFQIEAIDFDTAAGQHLSFFIARNEGELPPGLILTQDGRIVGFVQPALSIKPEDGNGTYDNSYYDAVAFDFAYRPTNGFDSYFYDNTFFDYSSPTNVPRKLNRNYEFIVTVTDGDSIAKRKFKIFVVGDDYFRADNTSILDGTGLFTADNTYLRAPVWLTPANLGTYRANNYITIPLEIYDNTDVFYTVDAGELPTGMYFDQTSVELYGAVPYQPAITKSYTFTVSAIRMGDKNDTATSTRTFSITIIGEVDSVITWNTDPNLGSVNANFISTLSVSATSTITDAVVLYTITSGRLPPGLNLDLDGEIVGKVNQYSTETELGLTTFDFLSGVTTFDNGTTTVDRDYVFTVLAQDQFGYSATSRTFTIVVDTPNQLVYSNIKVKPYLKLDQRAVWRDFINDPAIFTPSSVYRPNDPSFGLQEDLSMLIYAGIETTEAAKYISAMGLNHKRKRFQFGSVSKATAYITGTTTAVYEVVYVNMIDPLEVNGKHLPKELKHLGKQSKKITTDSSNVLWTNDKTKLAVPAPSSPRPEPMISIDSTGYTISDNNPGTYYPNSISIWQDRLKNWSDGHGNGLATERNYLPLWMRSIQTGTKQELGFQLAIPLCYCKIGSADDIVYNIKHSSFDFKLLDYTVDRYIIDSVEGLSADKYLVFRNDRITV